MAMLTVDGVALPTPSHFEYGLMDISRAESGRDDTGEMHKNRIGQKVKIELEWKGKSWEETAAILQAVNPQYITVTYPDMLTGKYETKKFYVGDRSAPVKLWWENRKLVSLIKFNIIEK